MDKGTFTDNLKAMGIGAIIIMVLIVFAIFYYTVFAIVIIATAVLFGKVYIIFKREYEESLKE